MSESGKHPFAKEHDRRRLTPVAVQAYRALASRWSLTDVEAARLLGASLGRWRQIKGGQFAKVLSQDQLTRVSAVVGVFHGLGLIFADDMAVRWPRLPNRASLLGHRTPIEAMIEGGIPRMIEVRRYVEAALKK